MPTDGDNGLMVEPGSREDLARTVLAVLLYLV